MTATINHSVVSFSDNKTNRSCGRSRVSRKVDECHQQHVAVVLCH